MRGSMDVDRDFAVVRLSGETRFIYEARFAGFDDQCFKVKPAGTVSWSVEKSRET